MAEVAKDLKDVFIEDEEEVRHYLAEARGVNALEFFGISYLEELDQVAFDQSMDFKNAFAILDEYMDAMENDSLERSPKVQEYIDVIEARGDDAVFDYAGTYVIGILSMLELVAESCK